MHVIKTRISINDRKLIQNQYVTIHFMVTEIDGKKILFLPGNTLFSVNTKNKTLKEVNLAQQVEQVNKVKTMLGEFKIENINESKNIKGYKTREIKACNVYNNKIKFSSNTVLAIIPGIEKTIYPEFH